MDIKITEQSKELFIAYVRDAGDWSGSPCVGGNVCMISDKVDRGNLTHLKRLGLVTTHADEGLSWLSFTMKGHAYAKELGLAEKLDGYEPCDAKFIDTIDLATIDAARQRVALNDDPSAEYSVGYCSFVIAKDLADAVDSGATYVGVHYKKPENKV